MNKTFFTKSFAKINLCLNIVNKKKEYHLLQSLFSFISLHDKIYVSKINRKNHKIVFKGKFSNNIPKNNTLSKTFKILEKKKLLKNKYLVKVEKNIPQRSGMGGGSMNAASLINLLVRNKILRIKKKLLLKICDEIGNDVKLGLQKRVVFLNKNKLINLFNYKTRFYVLLFMPKQGCRTKEIFSKVKKFSSPYRNIKKTLNNLKDLKNDLQTVVLKKFPKINGILIFLEKTQGLEFVRMTGSGSCFVAYFKKRKDCINAIEKFRKNYQNYWSVLSKTI